MLKNLRVADETRIKLPVQKKIVLSNRLEFLGVGFFCEIIKRKYLKNILQRRIHRTKAKSFEKANRLRNCKNAISSL